MSGNAGAGLGDSEGDVGRGHSHGPRKLWVRRRKTRGTSKLEVEGVLVMMLYFEGVLGHKCLWSLRHHLVNLGWSSLAREHTICLRSDSLQCPVSFSASQNCKFLRTLFVMMVGGVVDKREKKGRAMLVVSRYELDGCWSI